MVQFDGAHNDCRPALAWDAMTRFACRVLGGNRTPPATGLADKGQLLCHVSMFVVRDGRFLYDMSLPSPMCIFVGARELVATDPFAPSEGPLVLPYNAIRSIDAPQDGVMRVALGENDGVLFSCTDALQLMARTDAAINQLLRDQIVNDRPVVMAKGEQSRYALCPYATLTQRDARVCSAIGGHCDAAPRPCRRGCGAHCRASAVSGGAARVR